MISSPDVTRCHNANFSKQRGVIPTEIYILSRRNFCGVKGFEVSCFQSNHVPGILTTSSKHWARQLRLWSDRAHSLCTSLPHYKLLIRWCSCGVSRSEHGAKVHDKHEEHRISHQTTPRQKTINVRTRSTTKTPRQHAVQQLRIWSAPPGKGCVKVFLTFTRDLDDAGTLRPLQIRKSWTMIHGALGVISLNGYNVIL